MNKEIEKLQEIIDDSENIVFFGGAGVSTESGIPDFRSTDGLYNQEYDYPPEEILSHTFFVSHTEAFYGFYRDKMLCLTAEPNAAHKKLAELEQKGKMCSNFTAASTVIIVPNVINFLMLILLQTVWVFQLVTAVV